MDKPVKAYLLLHIVSIFTFGIALIVISYLPFYEIKSFFDYFVIDGDAQTFSIKHVLLIRSTGVFVCVVGGLVYIFRKKVLQFMPVFRITDFLINPKSIWEFISDFISDIKEAARKEDKIHSYTFILIIMLAIAARIYNLDRPFITDESRIFDPRVYHAHGFKGFIDLVTGYYIIGDHMFQTLLSYLTYKLLGSEQSMWTYRLPSFIAGTLLVPAMYMVIRFFYHKRAALLASGIVAGFPYLILYSQMARGYILICLFFFLILGLGAYLLKNNNKLSGWHLFAILSALGFYTMPLMLYPYGIVITWLMLSIIVKDTHIKRSYLVKNLFISMIITVILTFLLYSPIIFFGTGIKSLYYYYHNMVGPSYINYLMSIPVRWPNSFELIWKIWTGNIPDVRNIPDIMLLFFAIGLFISLFFHKKISAHRINIFLAACIFIFFLMVTSRSLFEHRHFIFMLPVFIGLTSSGLTYLFSPLEKIFRNHKSAMYSVLALTISIFLFGMTVQPSIGNRKVFFDETGKYTDFVFIFVSLQHHQLSELYGMNVFSGLYNQHLPADVFGRALPPENYNDFYSMPKTLVIFKSPSKHDFWMAGLTSKISLLRKPYGGFVNNYMDWYLSRYSRICHSLFLISDESIPSLLDLLDKKGVSVSDYSSPEIIHRYKYANLYKITRTKNCMKYNAMEKKAVNMAYTWKVYASNYRIITGRFPGDSDNDGLIGHASKEQTPTTPPITPRAKARASNMYFPPKNPIAIGNYQFWVYIGYDSTNTNKNVVVICKTSDCADGTKFTKDELKLIEAIDTAFDGVSDAGKGQFRASTKVVLLPDLIKVNRFHKLAVTEVTAVDETSEGSSTPYGTSHNSAVWLFDRPY